MQCVHVWYLLTALKQEGGRKGDGRISIQDYIYINMMVLDYWRVLHGQIIVPLLDALLVVNTYSTTMARTRYLAHT